MFHDMGKKSRKPVAGDCGDFKGYTDAEYTCSICGKHDERREIDEGVNKQCLVLGIK